jgi:two-component system chemotaxis response regulator CheB
MLAAEHAREALVIGGSAGAIDALRVLLPKLADGLRIPVVVVVHLPPRRKSLLCKLFGDLCAVPVREPFDKQPLAAGSIWFAPPDYHLLIEPERCFGLSIEPPVKYSRPSVDVLFESAAHAYGAGVTGVVLSGASDDGAQGAMTIRQRGGQVYVQAPADAQVSTMPEAAMRAADPQFVGHMVDIAARLRDSGGWAT